MNPEARFGAPSIPPTSNLQLAEVVAVNDPDNRGRIQVRLLSFDAVGEQDAPVWARVAVPYAGPDRGAFMIPGIGEEVIVGFINGDPRLPIVTGALWNGRHSPPEQLPGDAVDRWSFVGTNGTRIAIVEESAGTSAIEFSTPAGVTGTLTDDGGGKIRLHASGATITIDSSGVSIQAPGQVKIEGSTLDVTAGVVTVNAGMSTFSGVVQCDTLLTNTVVASTYTPGAGNVW